MTSKTTLLHASTSLCFIVEIFLSISLTMSSNSKRQITKAERKANDFCTRISQYFSHFNHKYLYHGNQRSRRLPLQDANDPFYGSCHNYREPMLGSS